MKITENIHLIDGIGYSNVFLIVDKDLTLIDTGMPNNGKKILEYISNLGFKPSDVKQIIITHYHPDHMGSLFEVWSETKADIFVHDIDSPYVAGKKKVPLPKGVKKFLYGFLSLFMKFKFVESNKKLKDGDTIKNLKVIHTPGHTPGHICLYDSKRKILFSADMFRVEKGKIKPSDESFVDNKEELEKSLVKISKLDFDVICPGHGDFVKANGKVLLEEYMKGIKK
jgi:glyoxylase-like metal-dependent hydrolase (beta-lactamase superfamily II)